MNDGWIALMFLLLFILLIGGLVLAIYSSEKGAEEDCQIKCNKMGYDYWDTVLSRQCECLNINKERVLIQR